jgi:hypothetical protein
MATRNAKILGTMMFVLVPSLAHAQSGPTVASVDKPGILASPLVPWLGSGANGSDGNGSITPSGGEFDAHHATAPSSKRPIAFRGQPPM